MRESPFTWKGPEARFSDLWKRIPPHIRLAFASAVVLGFATHLYMFANKLTNHDDIGDLFSSTYGTASGRWLLPVLLQMDGPFSTPWLIGTLSVLCLAVTVCLTVSLFRIRRPLACVATAAVMVTFPAVTATFTYMFTADAYFFSLMLAAFSAYAAVRLRWGTVLGAIALILSMGIYQSYFSVAAVLMVGSLLFEVLDAKRSFKELFLMGCRLLAVLAASIAAYMAVVKFTTLSVPLVDYMGISSMGHLSLRELPHLIFLSYARYFTFFLRDDFGYHFRFLKYAFAAAALCTIALGVLLLRERRLGPARTALAVVLAAIYPMAGNLITIMAPGGFHTLMLYGFSYILIAPVALSDYAQLDPKKLSRQAVQSIASWTILLAMALTAYSYAITANTAYLSIDLSMRQCTAYSTRLLDRVESCEGYQPGMPLVLLGSYKEEDTLHPTPQAHTISMTGVLDLASFRTSYTYGHFLRYYLGFPSEVYLDGSEEAEAIAKMPSVQAMPSYPAAGCVQVIDGMAVAKLN